MIIMCIDSHISPNVRLISSYYQLFIENKLNDKIKNREDENFCISV